MESEPVLHGKERQRSRRIENSGGKLQRLLGLGDFTSQRSEKNKCERVHGLLKSEKVRIVISGKT